MPRQRVTADQLMKVLKGAGVKEDHIKAIVKDIVEIDRNALELHLIPLGMGTPAWDHVAVGAKLADKAAAVKIVEGLIESGGAFGIQVQSHTQKGLNANIQIQASR